MKIRHVLALVSILITIQWFQNCSPVNFEPTAQMQKNLGVPSNGPDVGTNYPDAPCFLNGQTIASGSSVQVFQSPTVPYGSTCNSEYRICTNGTLSGSFTAPSCTVEQPKQNPPLPPAGVNVHIQCYVSAGWYQSLRVTTADGVAHDYGMGAGTFAAPPIDVVWSSPPVSFQAFHNGAENAYRWPSPYTGITSNSVAFETEDGFDYDYNDLDCYFSW